MMMADMSSVMISSVECYTSLGVSHLAEAVLKETRMTTIGIIGSGHVGSNLAEAAIAHGYDVVLSNSQGPDTLTGLINDLGSHARAATPAEAAAEGDFAIVAIPVTTIDQVPVEPLAGKVVIATINYFPQRDGHFPQIDNGTTTVPGLLQAHLPTSRVVRAFSMINAAEMSGDGHPEGDPKRRALALAGDDPAAKQLVARLYNEFGFDAVDIGGLDESWRIDAGQPAFVVPQNVAELKANVAKAKRGA
jgi:8-hydroxy-5-deazaflavin:NADPH oxidoreductase